MKKLVDYEIPHCIVDMDVANENLYQGDRTDYLKYLSKTINWLYENLKNNTNPEPRIYMNFQDFCDAYTQDITWTLRLVKFLKNTPITAVTFEDGRGTFLPFQIGIMTNTIRIVLGDDKKLLLHLHAGNGTENAGLIEGVLNGADGIWAGFTKEAAIIGHASTAEFLVNLMRVGNQSVADTYQIDKLLTMSQKITKINTSIDTPNDFPIIGSNAYRTMLSFFEQKGSFTKTLSRLNGERVGVEVKRKMDVPAENIGGKNGYRITPVVSDDEVIYGRMKELNIAPDDLTPNDAVLGFMRIVMRRDLVAGNRFVYDDKAGLKKCYSDALKLIVEPETSWQKLRRRIRCLRQKIQSKLLC